MGVAMEIDGPLARASRFERQHLGGALDTWLIRAFPPVIVIGRNNQQIMRSQFLLTLARLDDLPDGGYPRKASSTHVVALGVLAQDFYVGWLDDGVRPTIGAETRLLYAEFAAENDIIARAVCRATAAGFARGELPMQGRHVGLTFVRGVRMVALALGMASEVELVGRNPD
jgi:hypothetical protein